MRPKQRPAHGHRGAARHRPVCQVALDDVQILGDRVRDVSSYLEEHPEVAASINDEDFASIKDDELRSRLKQLFGQPALA